ncbi:MAG: DNA-processing protein DprA [Candidatus Omnitrophica bacterium]|nr:DNA-processing protein DprA [Candidatus Omnitrophota bacterium]MBU1905817.1 DNA-processing protein DprA [Candidatus Omnitrophota bacterium]
MTRFEALVSLNLVGEIGSARLKKLLDYFGKPENILKAPRRQLIAVSGIAEEIAGRIKGFKKEELDREFKLAKEQNIKIITSEDRDYPENLKNIPDPPVVLYLKGNLHQADNFSIGIVGSRRASIYGLKCAQSFAVDLASYGFTIISGMARGIDTYAHRGALKTGSRTIAVMGSGFNRIYPPENRGLAEAIAKSGVVISEFPMNMEPFRHNFPRRNRIISGLSLGVLVVEAARNSGALITADCALEQGRDVFALPGKVDSDNSSGTNSLIQQGAKLVSCADDIREEFDMPLMNRHKVIKGDKNLDLSDQDEHRLYDLILSNPQEIDGLVEQTNIEVGRLSAILLRLQLKRLIKALPGRKFAGV